MAMAKKATTSEIVTVTEIKRGQLEVCILGTSPLCCNAMSAKAKRDLLCPKPKKNNAEKAATAKHDPLREYRDSVYRGDDGEPTRIKMPAPAFKGAIADMALDLPEVNKATIGRLVWVLDYRVPIWGTPQIYLDVVRLQDMARTPDIRTRALLPEWASRITIEYAIPLIKETVVATLLSAAGMTRGVGDGRPQKGKLTFGQFAIVSSKDPRFVRLMKEGAKVQDEALENPQPYNAESADLLEFWKNESARRGFKVA